MKVVILAGGKGTRGRPFTDYFPKATIPVLGRPIIDYIIQYVTSFRFVDEVIILADYNGLGKQIKTYFENRKVHKKKISFVQDSDSGTAGDLMHLSGKIKGTEFVLWFVDNLCAVDLAKMYKSYKRKNSLACIATRRYRKEETGYAVVKDGLITEFREKPIIKLQMAECLGIYILSTKILKIIKSKKKKSLNLSFDILQDLSKKKLVSSFDIDKTSWVDIESPEKVMRNEKMVQKIVNEMRDNLF